MFANLCIYLCIFWFVCVFVFSAYFSPLECPSKVSLGVLNAFGNDDDDFDFQSLIDNYLQVSHLQKSVKQYK